MVTGDPQPEAQPGSLAAGFNLGGGGMEGGRGVGIASGGQPESALECHCVLRQTHQQVRKPQGLHFGRLIRMPLVVLPALALLTVVLSSLRLAILQQQHRIQWLASPSNALRFSAFGSGFSLSCTGESTRATSGPESEFRVGLQARTLKFLLLTEGYEQLSKGRKHFAEAMVVAQRLNRTLILPHVGHSVIESDHSLPFCSYFDVDRLGEYVPWVTQDWFVQEVRELQRKPPTYGMSTFTVLLAERCNQLGFVLAWAEARSRKMLPASLGRWTFGGLGRRVECVEQGEQWEPKDSEGEAEGRLMDAAGRHHDEGVDLLILKKNSFNLFVTETPLQHALEYLQYAPHLRRAADSLSSLLLSPSYVAVHWRLEWMMSHIRHTVAHSVARNSEDQELFATASASGSGRVSGNSSNSSGGNSSGTFSSNGGSGSSGIGNGGQRGTNTLEGRVDGCVTGLIRSLRNHVRATTGGGMHASTTHADAASPSGAGTKDLDLKRAEDERQEKGGEEITGSITKRSYALGADKQQQVKGQEKEEQNEQDQHNQMKGIVESKAEGNLRRDRKLLEMWDYAGASTGSLFNRRSDSQVGPTSPSAVFLAADLSLKGSLSKSWWLFWPFSYDRGICTRSLAMVLDALHPLSLPQFASASSIDPGILGIIDKLICMKAETFLMAPGECGGGQSYTREIKEWRDKHGKLSVVWDS